MQHLYFEILFTGFRGTFGSCCVSGAPGASPDLGLRCPLGSSKDALPQSQELWFLAKKEPDRTSVTEAASEYLSLRTVASKTSAFCQVYSVVRV